MKLSWIAVIAVAFMVLLGVSLVLGNNSAVVAITLGFMGLTAAVLALRDR